MKSNRSAQILLLAICWVLILPATTAAQALSRLDSLQVFENAVELRSTMAGGFNQPQFSEIDLDGDNVKDLFVFDRDGDKVATFLNGGTPNTIDYTYAPEYQAFFPDMHAYAVLRDYNCDGKVDIFTNGSSSTMKLYENTSTNGNLSFALVMDTVMTDYGSGTSFLSISSSDIPGLVDIDSDGDLDVMVFGVSGSFLEWHKNMAVEDGNGCANFRLIRADACWGKFEEGGQSNDITLGISCRAGHSVPSEMQRTQHAGSSVAFFDEEADGDYEVVLGDLIFDNLVYLHNDGSANVGLIDTFDMDFPLYDTPVNINLFPAAFFFDYDNDGKEDMIAAPNAQNVTMNYRCVWQYKNVHAGNGVTLDLDAPDFLQRDMIDVGKGAYPALLDYNADGLMDLLIGNYSLKTTATNAYSGLTLYENTGTATDPKYELVTRDYEDFSTLFNPLIFGMSPAVGDMDGDGDDDIILGDADGKLHYFENTAPSGQFANFPNVVAQFKGIDVGQFATPTIADIDRDGKKDLVVGEMGGNLNYFRNIGTASAPDFANLPDDDNWGQIDVEPLCCTGWSTPFVFENPMTNRYDLLVGSEQGNIFYYQDFESHLGNAFPLMTADFGLIEEGKRTAIHGADINGDGEYEWMVGNVRGGLAIYSGNGPMTAKPGPATAGISFEVYPNPSEGLLRVRYAASRGQQVRVRLTDLRGAVLSETPLSGASGTRTLDTGTLPQGVYFVQLLVDGAMQQARKWVLTR